MKTQIEFTRVNADKYGNPRFVCHFLNLVNEQDEEKAKHFERIVTPYRSYISHLYDLAVAKARKINGSRYRAKNYGGGIVFTNHSPEEIEKKIFNILNN